MKVASLVLELAAKPHNACLAEWQTRSVESAVSRKGRPGSSPGIGTGRADGRLAPNVGCVLRLRRRSLRLRK